MRYFFLLFWLFSLSLQAQTVHGRLLDTKGLPVEAAPIQVRPSGINTLSNADGRFSVDMKPGEILCVYRMDYETTELTQEELLHDFQGQVVLFEKNIALQEVVITALNREHRTVTCICGSITQSHCCFCGLSNEQDCDKNCRIPKETVPKIPVWSYFPNPARDMVQVITEGYSGRILVWNMEGQLTASERISSGITRLDIQSWAPGAYVLVYEGADWAQEIGILVRVE
jgi:hypothetical protein